MEDDNEYWDHQRPGLRKAVCAWALVAVLVVLFGIAGLVWPSEPKSIRFTTAEADLALRARRAFDREQTEDLELSRPADDLDRDELDHRDVAFGR
jgi:hypothetical protein